MVLYKIKTVCVDSDRGNEMSRALQFLFVMVLVWGANAASNNLCGCNKHTSPMESRCNASGVPHPEYVGNQDNCTEDSTQNSLCGCPEHWIPDYDERTCNSEKGTPMEGFAGKNTGCVEVKSRFVMEVEYTYKYNGEIATKFIKLREIQDKIEEYVTWAHAILISKYSLNGTKAEMTARAYFSTAVGAQRGADVMKGTGMRAALGNVTNARGSVVNAVDNTLFYWENNAKSSDPHLDLEDPKIDDVGVGFVVFAVFVVVVGVPLCVCVVQDRKGVAVGEIASVQGAQFATKRFVSKEVFMDTIFRNKNV